MIDLVGQTIQQYRVFSFLGKGSYANVYKVWDMERSAYLAMKVLKDNLAADQGFVARFRQEAQTLESLQHPHIVRFYGLEQVGEMTFILMDFIDGASLNVRDYSQNGEISFSRILGMMNPVCMVLHYAHRHNIIHCDIKPGNILINKSGQVYVADFGIAQMVKGETLSGRKRSGTPAYMAPELIQGQHPTPQSDIYALGVLLYEILTAGRRPFDGSRAQDSGNPVQKIFWEHVNLPVPSFSQYNLAIPGEVEAVILRCLDRSPRQRYDNPTELLNDLQRAQLSAGSVIHAAGALPLSVGPDIDRQKNAGKAAGESERAVAENLDGDSRLLTLLVRLRPLLIVAAVVMLVILLANIFDINLFNRRSNLAGISDVSLASSVQPTSIEVGKTLAESSSSQTYPQQNRCIDVMVYSETGTQTHMCINSVMVLSGGEMRFNFSWSVSSDSDDIGVTIYPDTGNRNMYLTDNMGNRLDHIETGGGANDTVTLYDGDSKTGWFLFPEPEQTAEYFIFHDDDNGRMISPISKTW